MSTALEQQMVCLSCTHRQDLSNSFFILFTIILCDYIFNYLFIIVEYYYWYYLSNIIDDRNDNFELKNRNGAGVMPYELLKPFSEPGVTEKGVPYSISIWMLS